MGDVRGGEEEEQQEQQEHHAEEQSQMVACEVPQEVKLMQYRLEDYKKQGKFGIRQSLPPKKQVFSVGSKAMGREKSRTLALSVLVRLHRGEPIEKVKEWAYGEQG